MASDPLDHLGRLFLREHGFVIGRDKTSPALNLKKSRLEIANAVSEIGKSGNLDLILAVEQRFLENDQAQYANSPAMKRSLETAMAELHSAQRHTAMVDDPKRYRAVDGSHSLPKNRKAGLPYDEARQFFNSHAARLLNMDKSRLDAEEKKIVDLRKSNMRTADKLYADRQRKTLGIEVAQKPQRGLGLGMGR